MKVVLYTNERNKPASKGLQNVIETCVPLNCLEVFRTSRDFSLRIYQIPRKIDVAILVAHNHDQLSGLILLKDFLIGVRIILILPDREHLTVIKGQTLSPSYTSYIDSNPMDIAKVLKKLNTSMNSKKMQADTLDSSH